MDTAKCELCGEPMPPGETMFKFHGYSGPCPKEPLAKSAIPKLLTDMEQDRVKATQRYNSDDVFSLLVDKIQAAMNETGMAVSDVYEAACFLE